MFGHPCSDCNRVTFHGSCAVGDVVVSDDPTQFLLQRLFAIPAAGSAMRSRGPERPLQVSQIVNVTLSVNLVRGDCVLSNQKNQTWWGWAGLPQDVGIGRVGV